LETRKLLARAVKLLLKYTWDNPGHSGGVNWHIYAEMFGVKNIAEKTYRFFKSYNFKDDDFPERLINFLNRVAEKDEQNAKMLIKEVIRQELDLKDKNILRSDPELIKELELEGEVDAFQLSATSNDKVLSVNNLPDDFYSELQEQINKAFKYEIYPAVLVLVRKLLENLIIDILRKKYGMDNIEMFYYPNEKRFHSFSVLINKLKKHREDFITIEPAINQKFIDRIDNFREKGNASAHSITLYIDEGELKHDMENIEYVVKILVRTLRNIP